MTIAEIQLFKGAGRAYHARISLDPLLRQALGKHLGPAVEEDVKFVLIFHKREDTGPIPGTPELTNMLTSFGEVDVMVLNEDTRMIYRHRYAVRELFGSLLQDLVARLDPDEKSWAFRISHPVLDRNHGTRPVPQIEGTVDVDLHRPRHVPFIVSKADEPEVTTIAPAELGIDSRVLGPINVLMSEDLYQLLMRDLPLNQSIEEGGFLLGTVRKTAEDERYLIEITEVSPAQNAGAGAGHFTFTGDSFSAVNERIAERDRGEQLIGWYHTHPFAASSIMGLSTVDVDLHFATFRRPWQVAGLINVTENKRVLRFYGRVANEMRACSQWIRNERDRYGPAGP